MYYTTTFHDLRNIEIVFVKYFASNHMLVDKVGFLS